MNTFASAPFNALLLDGIDSDDYWMKGGEVEAIEVEKQIYERLGPHPRIAVYYGPDLLTAGIRLRNYRMGNLHMYLLEHGDMISIEKRLRWAIDIAEGLAHMHSRNIVWGDTNLGNVLMTDDGRHVVLCDFNRASLDPTPSVSLAPIPPMPYICSNFGGPGAFRRQDIFGFGVILFALLSLRFPHGKNLTPSVDEMREMVRRHDRFIFDVPPSTVFPGFCQILARCFDIKYKYAQEILNDLEDALDMWLATLTKVWILFSSLHHLQPSWLQIRILLTTLQSCWIQRKM